ncbi:hypothetical protein [Streptomyces mirabilis]|uniref:hypothetical protein n=1 Tax=Streptomyces mirabilis TaxID=68239 RepID=UPI0036757CFB
MSYTELKVRDRHRLCGAQGFVGSDTDGHCPHSVEVAGGAAERIGVQAQVATENVLEKDGVATAVPADPVGDDNILCPVPVLLHDEAVFDGPNLINS